MRTGRYPVFCLSDDCGLPGDHAMLSVLVSGTLSGTAEDFVKGKLAERLMAGAAIGIAAGTAVGVGVDYALVKMDEA